MYFYFIQSHLKIEWFLGRIYRDIFLFGKKTCELAVVIYLYCPICNIICNIKIDEISLLKNLKIKIRYSVIIKISSVLILSIWDIYSLPLQNTLSRKSDTLDIHYIIMYLNVRQNYKTFSFAHPKLNIISDCEPWVIFVIIS